MKSMSRNLILGAAIAMAAATPAFAADNSRYDNGLLPQVDIAIEIIKDDDDLLGSIDVMTDPLGADEVHIEMPRLDNGEVSGNDGSGFILRGAAAAVGSTPPPAAAPAPTTPTTPDPAAAAVTTPDPANTPANNPTPTAMLDGMDDDGPDHDLNDDDRVDELHDDFDDDLNDEIDDELDDDHEDDLDDAMDDLDEIDDDANEDGSDGPGGSDGPEDD